MNKKSKKDKDNKKNKWDIKEIKECLRNFRIKVRDLLSNFMDVNKSLRMRMSLIMIIIVVSITIICWGINRLFLVEFYKHTKINALQHEFDELNKMFSQDVLEEVERAFSTRDYTYLEGISDVIEGRTEMKSIDIYILNSYTLGSRIKFIPYYPITFGDRNLEILETKLNSYFAINSDVNKNEKKIIYNEYKVEKLEGYDEYDIYKTYDERLGSNSLDLFGRLDSGVYVVISSNFESMQESVAIANRFLAYIGLAVTFVAGIVVFLISKTITKPILEISEIAQKMAGLDFNVKYNIETEDEIAILGKSINTLSEKLKETVSELKVANAELLNDIENKTKIDNMRKEFLSNISHELKTPIALVQGYAEGLKDNINDDEESKEFYCDVIIDEAQKMNRMIVKLLDLNHIEFGDADISMERFDIVSLLNEVLASTSILFQQNEAKVIFNQKEPIYVWADAYMIEEVITNYISNALNHLDDKKIIEIKLIEREEVVRVAVYNTGKNIPEEDIPRIWDKFYKVDKARTREYGGSGVGLSIVRAIMDAHGRSYGVVNREKGVEFWFELDTKT